MAICLRSDFLRPARLLFIVAALCIAPAAMAVKIFDVNSFADGIDDDLGDAICHTNAGTCTLRAAIMQATNADAFVNGVNINLPAGIYSLTLPIAAGGGELNVADSSINNTRVNLIGANAATTIIDANRIDRVLHVGSQRVVSISGITLRNGLASASGYGGGVFNEGFLVLNSAVLEHNEAVAGGGIYSTGDVNLLATTISANIASDVGGGIYNDLNDDPSIINRLNMFASTIESNSGDYGGGIANSAAMIITNSTIAANVALTDGGGIYSAGYDSDYVVNIYDTTIAFNDADDQRSTGGSGGGIAVFDDGSSGPFNVYNSVIALNYVSNSPQPSDCNGKIFTHARNRFGSFSGCTLTQVSGSYTALAPLALGNLQYNGGPTETIALPAGSNAIDAGDPVHGCLTIDGDALATDQRGFPRDVAVCDLGAYEVGALNPIDPIFGDGFDGGL